MDNAWITQRAYDLAVLHSPGKGEEVEMAVSPATKFAVRHFIPRLERFLRLLSHFLSQDLEVRFTSRHHTWKWECMRTAKLGAALLSQHLILPLITFNEAIVNAAGPLSGMDETAWTKVSLGVHTPV